MKNQLKESIRQILRAEEICLGGAMPLSACKLYNEGLLMRKMPDCQSVFLFAIPYYNGAHPERNLSLYAAPRDYHLYVSQLEERMVEKLSALYPNEKFALTADHSPIDERDAAWRLGLGVKGDNHLLITEEYGSFVFLAEILSTLAAECYYENDVLPPEVPVTECLHCGACQKACPCPDGCLSAITQKKGDLSEEEIQMMLDSGILWGCDVCQTVCPLNRDAAITPIAFFRENTLYRLTLGQIEEMSPAKFKERAFSFRGKKTILRNVKLYEDTK